MIKVFLLVLVLLFNLTLNTAWAASSRVYNFAIAGIGNRVSVTNCQGSLVQKFTVVNDTLTENLLKADCVALIDLSGVVEQFDANEAVLPLEESQVVNFLKIFDGHNLDYLIYGYITNLSIKTSVTGINYNVAADGRSDCVEADLVLRIVDDKTKKVVFTATGKGESTTTSTDLQYSEHGLNIGGKFVQEANVLNALVKATNQASQKILKVIEK